MGNSPKVSAGLPTKTGCRGSEGLIENIETVLEPGLTVNMYFAAKLEYLLW